MLFLEGYEICSYKKESRYIFQNCKTMNNAANLGENKPHITLLQNFWLSWLNNTFPSQTYKIIVLYYLFF